MAAQLGDGGFTHFVWLRNNKGGFDAQLWTQDFTTGHAAGGDYRSDMPHRIGERVVFKVALLPEDRDIDLAEAKNRWPATLIKPGANRGQA